MDDIVFISASSFAFFAATTAVLYRLRGPILKRLREALYIRICLVFFDGLLAIGIGAVISWLNLIQKSTWTDGDERLLFGMWSVGLMAGGFLSAKGLYLAGETEDKEELKELRATNFDLERQRNSQIRTASAIRKVVREKVDRFLVIQAATIPPTAEALWTALNPQKQLNLIVHTMYGYIAHTMGFEEDSLRMVVYYEDKDKHCLTELFSHDGKGPKCTKKRPGDFFKLGGSGGAKSAVVACWQGQQDYQVYPSCIEAQRSGVFDFFDPEQKEYIRSLVVCKCMRQTSGHLGPYIVTLDSDREDQFDYAEAPRLWTFLDEMMQRIDYEYLMLQIERGKYTGPQTKND